MPTNSLVQSSVLRFNKALDFDRPDRIPVIYSPSPAGLYRHGSDLLTLFNQYPPDNAVTFDAIPQPQPQHVDVNGQYHEVHTDEWGTTWQSLHFGLVGLVMEYPIRSWRQAVAEYQFPVPKSDIQIPPTSIHDRYVVGGWISLFEKLHALFPMSDLLMDLLTEDAHCL